LTIQGISIQAWKKCSKNNREMLHPTIIEVSPEGKILYQMKEKLARTIVGGKVVREMLNLGVEKEADFCNIV